MNAAKQTSETEPTVFIVDDDISVRESLEALISFEGLRPRAFGSAEEFLARGHVDGPSCLILDVSLPALNGLDLQKMIAEDQCEMPIIFITGHGDIPMSVQAMKAGAVEFLTKPIDDIALLSAVRNSIERSRAGITDSTELKHLRTRWDSLTPREREVIELVAAGMLNKQVGYKLGISEITVKAHRGKAMQKMNAYSLADMVRMVSRLGLSPKSNSWSETQSGE